MKKTGDPSGLGHRSDLNDPVSQIGCRVTTIHRRKEMKVTQEDIDKAEPLRKELNALVSEFIIDVIMPRVWGSIVNGEACQGFAKIDAKRCMILGAIKVGVGIYGLDKDTLIKLQEDLSELLEAEFEDGSFDRLLRNRDHISDLKKLAGL